MQTGSVNGNVDAIQITKDLIKIDTRNPPGITEKAADYLENLFSSYRTKRMRKVEVKDNLVVEIMKGKPEIMLTSHLDTVPSSDAMLNPVVVNGKLFGRGSCDAKGCVAAICEAAFMVDADADVDVGLKLAFTCDEEVGGVNGLGYVFERERADYVIIGEPTGSRNVGVLQAAVLALDIKVKGIAGHTARQDAREGAIYRASEYIIRVVNEFRKMRGEFDDYRRFLEDLGFRFEMNSWHAVFNPAMIKGGTKRNVVAGECVINADVRFAPWVNLNEVREAIQDDRIEIRVEGFLQPYGVKFDAVRLEDDLILLNALKESIESKIGKATAVFSLGIGDTRHVRKHSIPAFYLGPGGGGLHAENEFVYLSELKKTPEIYVEVLKRLQNPPKN